MMLLLEYMLRDHGRRICWHVDTLSPLDDRPLHGNGPMDVVELKVQTASITDGVATAVPSPQRCRCCAAVCANKMLAARLLLLIKGRTS